MKMVFTIKEIKINKAKDILCILLYFLYNSRKFNDISQNEVRIYVKCIHFQTFELELRLN